MLRYCDQQFNATFNCFNCSLEEEWCRNKNSRYLCASCLNSFTHGVVHRRTFKLLSSFARSYSCRNVCSTVVVILIPCYCLPPILQSLLPPPLYYRALPYCLGAFPLPSPNPLRRSSQTPARS